MDMASNTIFRVVQILDGYTLEVKPSWHWENTMNNHIFTGNKVKINGYDFNNFKGNISEQTKHTFAKQKLETIFSNHLSGNSFLKDKLTLISPSAVADEKLCCSVYLNDVNIAKYFPEFMARKKKKDKTVLYVLITIVLAMLAFIFYTTTK